MEILVYRRPEGQAAAIHRRRRPDDLVFNYGEFAAIKSQAGLNSYKISGLLFRQGVLD